MNFQKLSISKNLGHVLTREEEIENKVIVLKAIYGGPQLRYVFKDSNYSTITLF
jgi:hypothetical protein